MIISDWYHKVVSVDPITGNRTVISSDGSSSGSILRRPTGIAIEASGSLVVVDAELNGIVRVDPVTGDGEIVSDANTGIGMVPKRLTRIAIDADGSYLVTAYRESNFERGYVMVRVDPVSGDRTIISGLSIGNGSPFLDPVGIAVEADGSVLVADNKRPAVIRIDPSSGDRSILSDVTGQAGSGPDFSGITGIMVAADSSIVLTGMIETYVGGIFKIDPVTGDRSIILGQGLDPFEALNHLAGVAAEADGSLVVAENVWVYDAVTSAVWRVDPLSGERTLLSFTNIGTSAEDAIAVPEQIPLLHAFPNPFRYSTTFTYRVPVTDRVKLTVYDLLGRQMAVLVDEEQRTGSHTAILDASAWPDGVYMYRLEAGNQFTTGSLVHRN